MTKKLYLEFRIVKHVYFQKDTVHLDIRLQFFDFKLLIRIPILFYNEITRWG